MAVNGSNYQCNCVRKWIGSRCQGEKSNFKKRATMYTLKFVVVIFFLNTKEKP